MGTANTMRLQVRRASTNSDEKREVIQLKMVKVGAALLVVMLLLSVSAFAAPGDKLLKFGMRGEEVQVVQKMLIEKGFYAGEADGIYGEETVRAVKDFQYSHGLSADGIVGRQTWMYLERSGPADGAPSRYSRSILMSATAYTAYDDGNSNRTCRGNLLRKGLVAVDPSVIPLGTRLYIPGYGTAIADDVGGAIKGNKIDLAFDSRAEALQFGRQRVMVYILD